MKDPRPEKIALEPDRSAPVAVADADAKLDEVMLAMDVVDTLRHERMLITRDINSEVRRESLVDRLRDIYRGQGIEVPDDILMDGVKALEEERFRYKPPPDSFGTRLAKFYINRRRWLPLLLGSVAVVGLLVAGNTVMERSAEVEQARIEQTLQQLPSELDAALQAGLATDPDAGAEARLEAAFADGQSAIATGDVVEAQEAISDLRDLTATLAQDYSLEIVQPGGNELSGIDYVAPNGQDLYYVIVDALTPNGDAVELRVTDHLTGRTDEVSRFGVQVPESVYRDLAADIASDGDVDAATVGEKARGSLDIAYEIPVDAGRILEWR